MASGPWCEYCPGVPVSWRQGGDCWQRCADLGYCGRLTPSADLPACRDEDPAWSATLATCYPDPPDYQHPEEPDDDI